MRDFDEPPEDLTPWLRAGLRRTDALVWRRWRFSLEEAQAWRAAGVTAALPAAQWRTAAVTPTTVEDWLAIGVDPSEAVRWHEFGVGLPRAREAKAEGHGPEYTLIRASRTAPLTARDRELQEDHQRFRAAGVPSHIAYPYVTQRWVDDDALAWACHHIPLEHAQLWASIALRPAEAVALVAAGRTPQDVIAEWWRAGIPFDEVADWIGAGLTAAEAVEQRAAGLPVEHAAALRALRRPSNG